MAREIEIRAPDEAQRLEAVRVFLRSFRQEGEPAEMWLEHFVSMLTDARLAHVLVALDRSEAEGKVVGCGALICFPRTAWIALMGVEPGLQKRGTGSLLMKTIMEHAAELGYRTVKLDATNFGRGLYARHGFVDEYPANMYEIPARCDCVEREGPHVRLDEELPEWCLELDREAAGDDRSSLLRAVLADGGKVLMVEGQGFGLLHGRKVGPVIARSLETAVAIVRRADSFGVNRVYVPRHSKLPGAFLDGLKEIPPRWELKCCTRMIYGEPLRQNLSLEYAGYSAATG
jgi:GNAT superfamily N-acetyltransferase